MGPSGLRAIFLVMEWIDGENLASWLIDCRSVDEVIRIGREVAAGLAAAHAVGITHCDLKPQNILQDREGRIRVIDFGLAHWPEADDSPLGRISWLSRPGTDQPSLRNDHRADRRLRPGGFALCTPDRRTAMGDGLRDQSRRTAFP